MFRNAFFIQHSFIDLKNKKRNDCGVIHEGKPNTPYAEHKG